MSNNFETIYQDDEVQTTWERVPFLGGVCYYRNNISITGEYSSSNPLQFEADCCQWILESRCGIYKLAFDTLKEAQDASENLEF